MTRIYPDKSDVERIQAVFRKHGVACPEQGQYLYNAFKLLAEGLEALDAKIEALKLMSSDLVKY